MADVGRPAAEFGRGQLMLVTALGLAVLFVTLAVILNTAIYTENLGTRGSDHSDAGEVLRFHRDAEADLGEVVEFANAHNTTSYAELDAAVEGGMADWGDLAAGHAVVRGRAVDVTGVATTDGTQIRQHAEGAFTDSDGSATWHPVNETPASRKFRLNVSRSSLPDAHVGALTGVFRVRLTDSTGDVWTVYVYRNAADSDTRVAVEDPSGGVDGPCTDATGTHTVIDLTRHTVGGEACAVLDVSEDIDGAYNVTYANATTVGGTPVVEGTYRLVVEKPYGEVSGDYYPTGSDAGPYKLRAVYAATVDLTYQTPSTYYTAAVRVAPVEPRVLGERPPLGG